jgi:hypothetical protein
MMRTLVIALLLAILPAEALACTLVGESAVPAERDRRLRAGWQRAVAVVEAVVEIGSDRQAGRPGVMRVLRVHKGNVRVGALLPVFASHPAMCGTGDFPAGRRGVLMIGSLRARITFYGFESPGRVVRLRQLGLIR